MRAEGEWAPLDEAGVRAVAVRLRWAALCAALALVAAMAIASLFGGDDWRRAEDPEAVVARLYAARQAKSIRCGELEGTIARCRYSIGSLRCTALVQVPSASVVVRGGVGRVDCR